ncbi:hypothetical protein [Kibdelosporangium philippinense]
MKLTMDYPKKSALCTVITVEHRLQGKRTLRLGLGMAYVVLLAGV